MRQFFVLIIIYFSICSVGQAQEMSASDLMELDLDDLLNIMNPVI